MMPTRPTRVKKDQGEGGWRRRTIRGGHRIDRLISPQDRHQLPNQEMTTGEDLQAWARSSFRRWGDRCWATNVKVNQEENQARSLKISRPVPRCSKGTSTQRIGPRKRMEISCRGKESLHRRTSEWGPKEERRKEVRRKEERRVEVSGPAMVEEMPQAALQEARRSLLSRTLEDLMKEKDARPQTGLMMAAEILGDQSLVDREVLRLVILEVEAVMDELLSTSPRMARSSIWPRGVRAFTSLATWWLRTGVPGVRQRLRMTCRGGFTAMAKGEMPMSTTYAQVLEEEDSMSDVGFAGWEDR